MTGQQPIVHGTDGGYRAHKRRGEKPCRACTTASTEASQYRKRRRQALVAEEFGYKGGWVNDHGIMRPLEPEPRTDPNQRVADLMAIRDRIESEVRVLLALLDDKPPSGKRSRLVVPPCGTESAYQRHRHSRDTATSERAVTCEPCLTAHREHERVRVARAKLKEAS